MEILQYNTNRKPLIIPEYGRYIHLMIKQIMGKKDRKERNELAKAVIGVMGNLNPHLRDVPDFQHKLWDQLFIMSNFELDVDSPFEKPEAEVLSAKPKKLPYPQNHPKYRFYGNNIKKMIDIAIKWEDGELKNTLVYTIANHMKKCFLNWNKDTVEDIVIHSHLGELSNGKLKVHKDQLPLSSSSDLLKIKTKNGNGPKSNQNNSKRKNRKRY